MVWEEKRETESQGSKQKAGGEKNLLELVWSPRKSLGLCR